MADGDLDEVRALASAPDLDWGRVFDHATRHRVLPSVWRHLAGEPDAGTPEMHRKLALAASTFNDRRAIAYKREYQDVRRAFAEAGITALPRKGLVLSWSVYPDPSLRYMTDLDLFVQKKDLSRGKDVMHDLGYTQGALVRDHRRVRPVTREVEAFWLLHASSVPPYHRPTSDPDVRAFHVELRHNILEPAMREGFDMSEWFERAQAVPFLGERAWMQHPSCFLVDVVVHMYREAMTLTTVQDGRDLMLSKFVDVAEILSSHFAPDADDFVETVQRCALTREVFWGLHHTEILFPGSVPPELSERLDPGPRDYLDQFGMFDGKPQTWDLPFPQRMFIYRGRLEAVSGRSKLPRPR